MDVNILFEDEAFLAVDKPAGVIVNKADSSKGLETLQDWAEQKFKISNLKFKISNEYMVDGYNKLDEFKSRGGIVHRLDKETSGVILIAKTPEVFIELQDQFKTGFVKKMYLTLVHGMVAPREGRIEESIGRLPWNRMRFGVLPEGRKAVTVYRVQSYLKYKEGKDTSIFSFVEVYPETGRTHQIRVHFQHIKFPVFADILYAGRKTGRDDRKICSRHFLHAAEISFFHPVTKSALKIECPLPPDLREVLAHFTAL